MAKVTMVFGLLLVALGVWGWVATGSAHPTALIPCWAGLLFLAFGMLANTEETKRRALWMHVAVTAALLGFLGMVPAMVDEVRMLRGAAMLHPVAVEEKAAMGLLCLVFVGVCVRSFVAARKARRVAE